MTFVKRSGLGLLLGSLAVLTACPSNDPGVQVELSAKVGCGPADGPAVYVVVSAEPATDLLVEIVTESRMLASEEVDAGAVPVELPPLNPTYHKGAPVARLLDHAVAHAREAASGKLLAVTPVEPMNGVCP
ncbi:hypothetical protein ABN034_10460 [Actinopolymorpha sp. B11F2]|uniref:hypothetical protein n=1 Tax=Actinopolymorpha sp. B11F2 TaxID=3160862 RepID=UPI0032E385B7